MTRLTWRMLPTIIGETRPFWEACKKHTLVIQHCKKCGSYQHYPRPFCGECYGRDLEWKESRGKGTVWSFSVTYKNTSPDFKDWGTYVLAVVEVEEGVKLFTTLLECDPQKVRIGMPVEVTFEDVNDQIAIPCFRPAG